MKKITATILATLLMLSLGVFVLADGTTTLTTTVPAATYTLTIPQNVTVTYGVNSVDVGVLDAIATSGFAVGKNLKVTVSYTPFACEGVSTTIPYAVKGNISTNSPTTREYGDITSGDELLFKCVKTNELLPTDRSGKTYWGTSSSFEGSYKEYYFTLSFDNADWGKALGGDYIATMTFTSEIVAATE